LGIQAEKKKLRLVVRRRRRKREKKQFLHEEQLKKEIFKAKRWPRRKVGRGKGPRG